MPTHILYRLLNDTEMSAPGTTSLITPSEPGFYALPNIPTFPTDTLSFSATPVIITGISHSQDQQSSISLLVVPLRSNGTVTHPEDPKIGSRDHNTSQLFEFTPTVDSSFSRWGVEILYNPQTRDIWSGSDSSEWCLDTVCENTTVAFDILCLQNYTKRRDKFEQWTCDHCYPERNQSFLEEHCHVVGDRSALMVHIAVGLLLACITLTLIMWGIIIFRVLRHGLVAIGKRWYQECWKGSRKAKQDEGPPKLSKLRKKRLRNKRGLVPIMPPAHNLFLAGLPLNQIGGNAPDIELGLMQRPSGHSMHSANRAVSSGAECSQEPTASRRPSASFRGAEIPDSNLDVEENANSPSKDPRPLYACIDSRKSLHLSFSPPKLEGVVSSTSRRPAAYAELDEKQDSPIPHPSSRKVALEPSVVPSLS